MTNVGMSAPGPYPVPGSLAERLRPRRFADVIGQGTARAVLSAQARPQPIVDDHGQPSRGGRSVLLYGPPGCGKTSLAWIYANALFCQDGDGEPCLECHVCTKLRTGRYENLRGDKAKGQDDLSFAKDLVREVDVASLGGGWLVFLLEEPQWLSPRALDYLHDAIARGRPQVTHILCTTEPDRLPQRLRDGLLPLAITPLSMPARGELLHRAYRDRLLASAVDADAVIDIIARASDGVPHRMLGALEQVALSGSVTSARMRAHYGLDAARPAARYLAAAAARAGTNAQVAILDAWDATPAAKIAAIQALLGELFGAGILNLDRPGLLLDDLAARTQLITAFNACADRLAVTSSILWRAMLHVWRPPEHASDADLLVCVSTLHDLLTGSGRQAGGGPSDAFTARTPKARKPVEVVSEGRMPQRALDSPRGIGRGKAADPVYLSLADVEVLWDAASFLIQDRGLFLNTRLTLRHARLGIADDAIGSFVTELTHQIRARVDRHTGVGGDATLFHTLFVHETGHAGGACTHVAASLPAASAYRGRDPARDIGTWLRNAYLPKHLGHPCPPGALVLRHWRDQGDRRFARHLQLLRLLCRGLDRQVTVVDDQSGRPVPLIERIGVRASLRGPIGRRLSGQRRGASRQIDGKARAGIGAQDGLPVLSAFEKTRWSHLTTGWEVHEHAFRAGLREARVHMIAALSATWPDGEHPLDEISRAFGLSSFESAWADHVRERVGMRPGFGAHRAGA